MRTVFSRLSVLLLASSLSSLGCHAQTPSGHTAETGKPLSPAIARRLEVMLRGKAALPPASTITMGPRMPSDVFGYDNVAVTFTSDGKTSRPVMFLVSTDGKTAAQFSKFDISADPRDAVSAGGRPFRGGPATAPVLIVGFDDLECPFCARLHETVFPAVTNRYGDKVHIVYKDFPLDQHPWAMHASVDVNCLAAQSPAAYWSAVDAIHKGASDVGSDPKDPKAEKTLARATEQLDATTRAEGKINKLDESKLNACIAKQDTAAIEASRHVGESLNVESTPILFINGAKIDGAVPLPFLFSVIDDALRAENVTPPPPYVEPAPSAPTKQ